MAEAKQKSGGFFTRSVSKKASRTKEKLLQNFGKADATRDEAYESYVVQFTKQQLGAKKLYHEVKKYLMALKGMEAASKSLHEALGELHEPEWVGHDTVTQSVARTTELWDNFLVKLTEEAVDPLSKYQTNFVDVRQKVEKRERKRLDFDNARHTYNALVSAKKKDDAKIQKAEAHLTEAKGMFDELNNELHEEIPNLYDGRVRSCVTFYQAIYRTESEFFTKFSELNDTLSSEMEKLAAADAQGLYRVKRVPPRYINTPTPPTTPSKADNNIQDMTPKIPKDAHNGDTNVKVVNSLEEHSFEQEQVPDETNKGESLADSITATLAATNGGAINVSVESDKHNDIIVQSKEVDMPQEVVLDHNKEPAAIEVSLSNGPAEEESAIELPSTFVKVEEKDSEEGGLIAEVAEEIKEKVEDVVKPTVTELVQELHSPTDKIDDDAPPGTLHQVLTTHPYAGEDDDELTFEAGDMIYVVPYDDEDEQDDGWLMGILKSNRKKGVFPQNFTKPM